MKIAILWKRSFLRLAISVDVRVMVAFALFVGQ